MAQKKEVSIRLIAQECGVSTATVSRVLNNTSNVSDETRHKVINVLQKYQYSPPQSTNISKTKPRLPKIGIVMTSSVSDYYINLQQHIAEYFMKQNIRIVICNTQDNSAYLATSIETLYDSGVCGIIFISCDYLSIQNMLLPNIPCVWIDCNDHPKDTRSICQVQSDHYASGQLAAQELFRRGSRRPILLTGAHITHRSDERIKGFQSVWNKNQIQFTDEQIIYLPYIKHHFIESRDMVQYLLAKNFSFDSIFAVNDSRALGAVVGVQNSSLQIPNDIRIIGFDGISVTCNSILNITSIQQNTELLAKHACVMLEKQIRNEPIKEKKVIVPPHLSIGQTT